MENKGFKNWWFLALNGLVFFIFGLLILFFDQEQIKSMISFFGIIMLVLGGILLMVGVNNIRRDKSGAMILMESVAGIAIGLALLLFPAASLSLFLILIGIWAILIGIIQLVILVNIRRIIHNRNIFLINGLLTIGLGVAMLFNPFTWGVVLIKIIAGLASLFGLALIFFAFVLRSVREAEHNEATVLPK